MFNKKDILAIKHDLKGQTNALLVAIKSLKKVIDDPLAEKLVNSSISSINNLEKKHLELLSRLEGGQND